MPVKRIMPEREGQIFICHATEDKTAIARPLALALRRRGLSVWFDEFALRIGDSLRRTVESGLKNCRFGLVILSKAFFMKGWTQEELSYLHEKQLSSKSKVILPIWHGIDRDYVAEHAPLLVDLFAIRSDTPLSEIVSRVLAEVGYHSSADLGRLAPTGIAGLDRVLVGGLPRGTSAVIEGPKGIGKTTLATQIQIASLDRGEPCVYITYREAPHVVIEYFTRLGAPVSDYVDAGKFRVLDNWSAINGFSRDESETKVPVELRSAVVYVEKPWDAESYYRLQLELMDELGMGGVNVIDSVNERYRMYKGERKSREADSFFQRFKTRLATFGNQTGLHIATAMSHDKPFYEALSHLEDALIRMRYEEAAYGRRTFVRVEACKGIAFDDSWQEFVIQPGGIEVLGWLPAG